MQKMKCLALLAYALACLGCQTIPQVVALEVGVSSSPGSHVILVDIDPFYQWGGHSKIKLQGQEATELRAIIKSAPEVEFAPLPRGMTVSPPTGLSVIEDGDDCYHILVDCEIVGRKISLERRLRIFGILSRHTSHFQKPKA